MARTASRQLFSAAASLGLRRAKKCVQARRAAASASRRPIGTVKLTKSSSSDPQDTGLEPVANPPCWGSETAVSLNLTIPYQAVKREVLEETGLTIEPREILGVFGGTEFRYIYPNGDAVEYTVVLYGCDVTGRQQTPLDGETRSLRCFRAGEMPPLALP